MQHKATMTTFWHVILRTAVDYTWVGYFMFEPTPQDMCDILEAEVEAVPVAERSDPRARTLLELAHHIPEDYAEQAKVQEYSIKVALTEIGTIGIRKKEARTR